MNKRLQESINEREEEDQEWREFVDDCNDLLLDEDYDFASDTIRGIKNWVAEHHTVTDKQKEAIENIKQSIDNDFDDYDKDW